MREIGNNRSDFSTDALDQVSQEVANSFVTVRRFYSDTPTRARATPWRVWTEVQNDVHDNMDVFIPLADIPWTQSCPNIFSPRQSDIQAMKETFPEVHTASNGWRADSVVHEASHRKAAVVNQNVEAVARWDTMSARRHASSLLEGRWQSASLVGHPLLVFVYLLTCTLLYAFLTFQCLLWGLVIHIATAALLSSCLALGGCEKSLTSSQHLALGTAVVGRLTNLFVCGAAIRIAFVT